MSGSNAKLNLVLRHVAKSPAKLMPKLPASG